MFFNKIFKAKTKRFNITDKQFTSVQRMLSEVYQYYLENSNKTFIVRIPSEKYGLPYTDEFTFKPHEEGLYEVNLFEAEAQSYIYKKILYESDIAKEIEILAKISGNPKENGYKLIQF